MNRRDRMYEQIRQHGADLNAIFETALDDITLAKRLHSLEIKAHRVMEDYCNGAIDSEGLDAERAKIEKRLSKIIGPGNMANIYINQDPRGYTLKIDDNWTRGYRGAGGRIYTDWGGYGILAPEFDGR